MIPQQFILQAREDIFPSLKKYSKKDWVAHAKALQNIQTREKNIQKLHEIVEDLIPITKRLQDSVIENKKSRLSMWAILNEELLLLNKVYGILEEAKGFTKSLLKGFEDLTKFAKIEEDLIKSSI